MLSAADLAMMRAALDGSSPAVSAGLLPDTVTVENKTETPSSAGPTYSYATATANVACRFDPAQQVERVAHGLTVTVTEWPVWFAVGTAPTLGQVLNKGGTRYEVVAVDTSRAWSLLVEARALRVGAS